MNVAHISDTHLGYRSYGITDPSSMRNQRTVDFERAFVDAVDMIITMGPDVVLHAGDVFDMPRPDWKSVKAFIDAWKRIEEAGIPSVVISGNHDISRLRTVGSVFDVLRSSLSKTRFAVGWTGETYFLEDLDLEVVCMPWAGETSFSPDTVRAEDPTWKVLVSHGGVTSNLADPDMRFAGGEPWFDPKEYDYVALGDHHLHYRTMDKTWYAGSTERCGFSDERATPGWLWVELEKGKAPGIHHYQVEAREMKTLDPVDWVGSVQGTADVIGAKLKAEGSPGLLARVQVNGAGSRSLALIQKAVETGYPNDAWLVRVYAEESVFKGDVVPVLSADPEKGKNIVELFDEFFESRNYEPGFKEKFRIVGKDALVRAVASEREDAQE